MHQNCAKWVFPIENRKNKHHHWILHIQISSDTKFHIKQSNLNFGTKFIKKYFHLKQKKVNISIEFSTKFQLKLKIMIFLAKFAQKGYIRSKWKRLSPIMEFCLLMELYYLVLNLYCLFELFFVPNLSLNWQFWVFGPNLPKNRFSGRKLRTWTSPLNSTYLNYTSSKFQPKLTILICLNQIALKGYFYSETEKVNTTIEFGIFELF